jgi:hypothetical protein
VLTPAAFFLDGRVHLLYLDDSESPANDGRHVLVLAGFSVFERQTYWLEQHVDAIAARFDSSGPHEIELHGSPMYGGRGVWRRFPRAARHRAMLDVLRAVVAHRSTALFGAAVDLRACDEDPRCLAFEHVSYAFDRMLSQRHNRGDTQRGLMIFDKHKSEERIQRLARDFKQLGHRWGVLRNMAEVPAFLDSKASRLLQVADLIAYAVKRHFYEGDSDFFRIIEPRFFRDGGRSNGLAILPSTTRVLSSAGLGRLSLPRAAGLQA